jgi:putative membrane protein
MVLESLLAYAHLIAILSLVVFLSSEAALCRSEWMSAAVVQRLARVDAIYAITALAVLATGAARTVWGVKGAGWYWSQPLLYVKLGLFVVIGLLSIKPTREFIRWRRACAADGTLPSADEVKRTRRIVMIEAHLLILIPLAAVLLARGVAAL